MSELKARWIPTRSGNSLLCYIKSEVDKVISELKADYDEACDRLQTATLIKDKQIEELKAKLEDAKASAYAESVDAGMRERRLKRALYKACANWAHHRVFIRYKTNETAWENVERKCRAKAEQYQ